GRERLLHFLLEDWGVALFRRRLRDRLLDLGGGAATGDNPPGDGSCNDRENEGDDQEPRKNSIKWLRLAEIEEWPAEAYDRGENERGQDAQSNPKPAHQGHRLKMLLAWQHIPLLKPCQSAR